jgi:uncharacterized protein YggU (UPF0235/DUF167 family)
MCEALIADKIREAGKRCYVFQIYVIPKQEKASLELKDNELIFRSNSSCKRHNVNVQLISYLKKLFPGHRVIIVKGANQRLKLVCIEAEDRMRIARSLCKALTE